MSSAAAAADVVLRRLTLRARFVCPICHDLLNCPVRGCSNESCANGLMCRACLDTLHRTNRALCVSCVSTKTTRRKLMGLRRVRVPCGKSESECDCRADKYTCSLWREILNKYGSEIAFLNESPETHGHDVTIEGGVDANDLRVARRTKPGELVDELRMLSAFDHREEEELSRRLLREMEESERSAREARRRQIEADAALAREFRGGGDEDAENVVETNSLEAFFLANPEARAEHRAAEKRREQMMEDEKLARMLSATDRSKKRSPPVNDSAGSGGAKRRRGSRGDGVLSSGVVDS